MTDGPQNVSIHAPSPFISDGTKYLDLLCLATNVYPVPLYTWNGVKCVNNNSDKGICILKPEPPWDDRREVQCAATSIANSANTVMTTYSLNLACKKIKPP